MKIINKLGTCMFLAAVFALNSCDDIVTYNDDYVDETISKGAPSISGIYSYDDIEFINPLDGASFLDVIMIKGSNLSKVKKAMLNDVEVDVRSIYATTNYAYLQVPRVVPGDVNNKIYYETESGKTEFNFVVSVPSLRVEGLYNDYAVPGSTVQIKGDFFDLYGFGDEQSGATITMNGTELTIDSISTQYLSVVIPENATDNSVITLEYNGVGGRLSCNIPYRHTEGIIWDLSDPGSCGLWAGTEFITDGLGDTDPEALYGPYYRVKGSYGAWSWNNLPCGGFNMPAEVFANPSDYWFKFEVNSASGNPFYDSQGAGYIMQLNNGWYVWNPSSSNSFNTYGKWATVRLELTDVAAAGVSEGWVGLFMILQPNSDWSVDHSFANFRLEKKIN